MEGYGDQGSHGEAVRGGPVGGAVFMCGRSVMGGWFGCWGWEGGPGEAVSFEGRSLYYREMDSPPEIAGTARRVIGEAGAGGTVFFKLCFVDFEGGDRETAEANLERNQGIVRDVARASQAQPDQVLLLGNALPVAESSSDEWMVWNQRAYNDFLEGLAGTSSTPIVVVDLYGALATPDGYLDPSYASDPCDSHPNPAGYRALDSVLASALQSLD